MATVIGRSKGSETPENSEGRMTLAEHLRELRSRVFKAVAAIIVLGVLGVVFYQPILRTLTDPFYAAAEAQNLDATINFGGTVEPFTIPLRIGLVTGIVLGAPVWIYQAWAFITPALYRKEKRWTMLVVFLATPLFLAGVALCYYLLPKGLDVLLGMTPADLGISNYVPFSEYFGFVTRLVLVFGLAFLLPVFVLLLNAVGVLTGETLAKSRRYIIVGVFIFAAVATPTGDPITMLGLGVPMYLLFEAAIIVAKINDKRRGVAVGGELDDDEATSDEMLDRLGREVDAEEQ